MSSSVALFPGQGSQHVGMAKELYNDFKIAKEVFEEASDAAHLNLKKLCFDGPESDLTQTENTQPCLLTASVAAFRVAQTELGYQPGLVAGHSLGEYSALVAAGALSLGTAARWVRERGAAMQKAVPSGEGTMAAVLGLDDEVVERLCVQATRQAGEKRQTGEKSELTVEAVVQPANYNAPGQVVIAGSVDAVSEAVALIKAGGDYAGGKAILLQVSAPFHCKLMRLARDRMADLFAHADPTEKAKGLSCAYIPNRTARLTQETGVVFDLLVEQVDHPVLWKQSMVSMIQAGYIQGIEFGPGKVLQGLAKRVVQGMGPQSDRKPFTMTGLSDPSGIRALEVALKASTRSAS